ncbi:MAG: HlyD family secretion protein [Polyangiales bacterium]
MTTQTNLAILARMTDRAPRALAVFFLALAGCPGGEPAPPEPLQGVIEYDDRVIGFELGGRVLAVGVERGQQVLAGAELVRLDDGLERPVRELRAADVGAAQAQLKLLRAGTRSEELQASAAEISALLAQQQNLEKTLARQAELQNQGAAPQATLDSVSAELSATADRRRALEQRLKAMRAGPRVQEISAAEARVQAAQAALSEIDARLERYALHSPMAATVLDLHVKVGEVVGPGAPAATLADLTHPFVDVFVAEGKLQGIVVGAPMRVRADGISGQLAGHVEYVYPRTEFTPRFLFSESERPNLVLRVRVRVDDLRGVLHAGVPAFVALAGRGK